MDRERWGARARDGRNRISFIIQVMVFGGEERESRRGVIKDEVRGRSGARISRDKSLKRYCPVKGNMGGKYEIPGKKNETNTILF